GKAAVQSAQARVESAALDLEYCDVRAPISGLIGAKQVSVGDLVGKGEPTLLATISTQDPMWFYCSVAESQYLKTEHAVREKGRNVADLPVTLVLSDGSLHREGGKFVFIDRAVDPKTGTLRVRAEFRNPEKILKPGMFGRIRVELGSNPETLVIPERAVAELQGRNFVWVVGADHVATQRRVTLGDTLPTGVIVTEGLTAGERIVVEGLQKVREGQPVQPAPATNGAGAASAKAAGDATSAKAH
ncbi:MAG: efflux RND transporter periplasmic adaptor subunit, partial [Verrucomicrobiales bacterium]|nr:efflux RND transporter periplasmic adaptor subunit [Verrucomicrobiales bacterium]